MLRDEGFRDGSVLEEKHGEGVPQALGLADGLPLLFYPLQPGDGPGRRPLHLPPQGIEASLLEVYSIQELPLPPRLGRVLGVNLGRSGVAETRGLADLAAACAPRVDTPEARLEEVA